jgi:hypothetical protein
MLGDNIYVPYEGFESKGSIHPYNLLRARSTERAARVPCERKAFAFHRVREQDAPGSRSNKFSSQV